MRIMTPRLQAPVTLTPNLLSSDSDADDVLDYHTDLRRLQDFADSV